MPWVSNPCLLCVTIKLILCCSPISLLFGFWDDQILNALSWDLVLFSGPEYVTAPSALFCYLSFSAVLCGAYCTMCWCLEQSIQKAFLRWVLPNAWYHFDWLNLSVLQPRDLHQSPQLHFCFHSVWILGVPSEFVKGTLLICQPYNHLYRPLSRLGIFF